MKSVAPNCYTKFMNRLKIGNLLFNMLSVIFAIISGVLLYQNIFSWSITALLLALLFGIGCRHVKSRYNIAKKIFNDPNSVYWVHSYIIPPVLDFESGVFLLHSKNGSEIEIRVKTQEVRGFISWLSENNSGIRIGPYDID